MFTISVNRPPLRVQMRQLGLKLGERRWVDELAQLGLAQQFAEQMPVERQCLRLSFRQRRVLLVDIGRHVCENQRACERRCGARFNVVNPDVSGLDAAQQVTQCGNVENIA